MELKGKKSEWVDIGRVPVDAGCLVLIDPCYLTGKDKPDGVDPYAEIIAEIDEHGNDAPSLRAGYGTVGNEAGVFVSTGFGDGVYKAQVRYADTSWGRRVAEMRVVFIEDSELE